MQHDGHFLLDTTAIATALHSHFKQRFNKFTHVDGFITGLPFNKLSASHASFLERPFTLDEVRRAIWDCGSTKAPRPDGLNFFYKSFNAN